MAQSVESTHAMIDRVKTLNVEYCLDLTEEEIASIARQTEAYEGCFVLCRDRFVGRRAFAEVELA